MSQDSRAVAQIVRPEPVIEGAGVHLRRSIGTRRLDHLDPFLLLDHFESARPEEYRTVPAREKVAPVSCDHQVSPAAILDSIVLVASTLPLLATIAT